MNAEKFLHAESPEKGHCLATIGVWPKKAARVPRKLDTYGQLLGERCAPEQGLHF